MINWPPEVVTAIARRRSVILIGSGISANAQTDDGVRPPTWGVFLNDAYKKIGRRIPHIVDALKRYAYLEACDYLKTELGEQWPSMLREKFSNPVFRSADIHKHILDLDSRIVASLNFDKIYDNYAISATEGTVVIKNYYEDDIRQAICGEDRYVIKPHGSVDSISKVIFTLNEYGAARTKHSTFYEVFNSLLHTHTFICLGCGLSDPDMQLIFEDYRYRHNESPHFIALPTPIPVERKALIKRTRGMSVLTYSPKDNHKELTDSVCQLAELVSGRRDELADNQNW